MAIYNGFNTIGSAKKFRLTDFQLAKRDLSNYFSIRKGEKLMNADFGTIIWNMLFEPLTTDTKQVIINDIQRIVGYDPRLAVNNVMINELDYGLQIQIFLTYVPTNQADTLLLNFNNGQQQ
jgi:phage baseplate assembly protein W